MVGMRVGVDLAWDGGNDGIDGCEARQAKPNTTSGHWCRNGKQRRVHIWVARLAVAHVVVVVLSHQLECLFEHFPQLDGLVCCEGEWKRSQGAASKRKPRGKRQIRTICTEQKVSCILSSAPLDLVDLFFNFKRLEVVKLWLVRLKLGVELVLAALFL